jgi:hypothetical protein
LPQNLAVEKDERQAKRFCRAGEARLALLGLVREKGRWRTRAGRRRDGAFDERDDCFAGAASFAAYTDRHGGFAWMMEELQLIVAMHKPSYIYEMGKRQIAIDKGSAFLASNNLSPFIYSDRGPLQNSSFRGVSAS